MRPGATAAEAALRRVRAVADAVALVRDLVNTPPNDLYPAELAARGAAAGEKLGLAAEILDEDALAAGGYGGILAVGGGSARKPRLLRLTYSGAGARKKIALVGKGITFDSGGISIKPAAKMEDMKSDMAGAAAVIATVCLVAQLRLPVEVTATVPDRREPAQRHRLPAGRRRDLPQRQEGRDHQHRRRGPGRAGRRDRAGGRGPSRRPAGDLHPHRRAAGRARGTRTAGVMGTEDLRDAVVAAGRPRGEGMWPMPLPAELRRGLDSPVADFVNSAADRLGGMLVAGHFLAEFVPDGLPVGAHRHRRAELQHRRALGLHPQGRHRRPRAHPPRDHRGPHRRLTV